MKRSSKIALITNLCLAGVLLMLQAQAFDYLQALEVGGVDLSPIADFIERRPITATIADKHKQLLMLNKQILRRLSKK